MKKKDLCILIASFDGYKDLWDPFFTIFNHFWKDCPYDKYLITNNLEYEKEKTIKTGEEICWIDRMEKALNVIDYDYILFMMEDFFIGHEIDNKVIENVLTEFINKDAKYLKISTSEKINYNRTSWSFDKIKKNENYGIVLQAAIWKKTFLLEQLEIIKESGGESAWDFEIYFSKLAGVANDNEYINHCYASNNDFLNIYNGVLKGKWIRKSIQYFNCQGIAIDLGERKVMTLGETFVYRVKGKLSSRMTPKTKKKVKRLLTKMGVKFYSIR